MKPATLAAIVALAAAGCGGAPSPGSGPEEAGAEGAPVGDGGSAVSDAASGETSNTDGAPSDGSRGSSDAGRDVGADATHDTGSDAPMRDADSGDGAMCVPTCANATCGDDGCGGSCGQCTGTDYCGGGGVQGQCGSGAIGAYPGVTPVQIDTGAALGLRVSGDEKHVLVQRTESSSFDQGALAVITLDASGHGTATELTTAVDFTNGVPRADFTADSTGLYFVDGSATPRHLVVAAADGSGARTLASATVQTAEIANNTLVYMLDEPVDTGNRPVFAVLLPGGTPVQLVASGDVYYPVLNVSPDGAAVFVADQTGAAVHELVQTATGATTPIGPAGALLSGIWSPDGAHFAYTTGLASLTTVHVVNADGTGDLSLSSSAVTGFTPMFSPDGSMVAYATGDAGGNVVSVTVHYFAGGSDAILSFNDSRLWGEPFMYSPDGSMLAITSADGVLAVASTSQSGAFVEIATPVSVNSGTIYPCDWTLTHDYAAVPLTNRELAVAPTTGGVAQIASSPIDQPAFFEPVTSQPRLLAFTSVNPTQSGIYGSVALFATDGAGSPQILPGQVLPAFTENQVYHSPWSGWQGADSGSGQIAEPFTWGWLGSEIVYESDRDSVNPWFDLVSSTDTVGTVGVIAPGAQVWAVRQGSTPTTVFYTRPSLGGVWSSTLPQTPGR